MGDTLIKSQKSAYFMKFSPKKTNIAGIATGISEQAKTDIGFLSSADSEQMNAVKISVAVNFTVKNSTTYPSIGISKGSFSRLSIECIGDKSCGKS